MTNELSFSPRVCIVGPTELLLGGGYSRVCEPAKVKRVRKIPLRVEGGVQVMSRRTSRSDPDIREDVISSCVIRMGAVLYERERRNCIA